MKMITTGIPFLCEIKKTKTKVSMGKLGITLLLKHLIKIDDANISIEDYYKRRKYTE